MKVSVGDKVSFINEKLDGIVRSIVNNNFVKVEIDDGFIIDADVKQLVLIEKFIDNKTENKNEDIDFEKPVYSYEDYPYFQEFHKKLFDLLNEQYVYKKKLSKK